MLFLAWNPSLVQCRTYGIGSISRFWMLCTTKISISTWWFLSLECACKEFDPIHAVFTRIFKMKSTFATTPTLDLQRAPHRLVKRAQVVWVTKVRIRNRSFILICRDPFSVMISGVKLCLIWKCITLVAIFSFCQVIFKTLSSILHTSRWKGQQRYGQSSYKRLEGRKLAVKRGAYFADWYPVL